MSNSGRLGLDRKDALENLSKLGNEYEDAVARLIVLKTGKAPETYPGETQTLDAKRQKLWEQMAEIREWYSVSVLESIEKYSKELKWLTVGLTALTIVLAILTGLQVYKVFFR